MKLNAYKKLKTTKSGKLVIVLACLGFIDLFFSLSIDKGNLFYYIITLVFIIYFLKYLLSLIKDLASGLIKH